MSVVGVQGSALPRRVQHIMLADMLSCAPSSYDGPILLCSAAKDLVELPEEEPDPTQADASPAKASAATAAAASHGAKVAALLQRLREDAAAGTKSVVFRWGGRDGWVVCVGVGWGGGWGARALVGTPAGLACRLEPACSGQGCTLLVGPLRPPFRCGPSACLATDAGYQHLF